MEGGASTSALLAKLLTLVGVASSRVLTACLDVHRDNAGAALADTSTLNAQFRELKARVVAESRPDFEDVFMKLVSTVRASSALVRTRGGTA